MLAANAKLQPRTGRTSAVDREAYEFAHSVNIECDNGMPNVTLLRA